MQLRTLGKTKLNISAVSMGCWGISSAWGQSNETVAVAALKEAVDQGINFFDTADGYGGGESESFLGTAFQGMRDQVFIASKAGHHLPITSAKELINCCHASLFRLKTDYLDIYQCHQHDPEHMDAFLEGMQRLKEQGAIRHHGISTNKLDVLKRYNADGDCGVCQLNFSLLDRSAEPELLAYCLDNNIGTLVRGPLHRGLLTGKYDASSTFAVDDRVRRVWNPDGDKHQQYLKKMAFVERLREQVPEGMSMADVAIQFLLSYDAITAPITGIRTPEQAVINAASASQQLDPTLLEQLRHNRF